MAQVLDPFIDFREPKVEGSPSRLMLQPDKDLDSAIAEECERNSQYEVCEIVSMDMQKAGRDMGFG